MERMGDLSRVVPFAHCSLIGSRPAVRLRWRDLMAAWRCQRRVIEQAKEGTEQKITY
jgi:hypothetical protein